MKPPRFEPPNRLARLTPWLLGGAVLVILGGALFSFRLFAPDVDLDLGAEGRLVVLPVRNATGEREQDWVTLGLMDLLAETLRRTPGVGVVAPERLTEVIAVRGLDPEDDEQRHRVRELALALGAELALDVAATRRTSRGASVAELYSLRFEVVDAAGTALGGGELRGPDLARIAERLSYLVAADLAVRTQPVAMSRIFSSSPFLNRLYGMGVARLLAGDPDAARPHFDIALAVEPSFLAARWRIAECARRKGRLEESRRLTLEMIQEAQDRGEVVWEARALHALAVVEALDGQAEKAAQLADHVLSSYAVRDDDGARLAVLRDLASFVLASDDAARAGELYRQIGDIQQRLGDRLGRVGTLAQLGALALRDDDLEAALAAFDEARDLAADLGDVRTETQILASLGEVASRRGQRADAVSLWRRAATFYEQRGETGRQLLLLTNVAEALLLDDDLEAAEHAFRDVLELAVKRGDESHEALASLRLTWILLRRGYPYQARRHLDRAIELGRRLDQPLTLQRLIAWMAYEEGNFRLAVDTLGAVKRQAGDGWNELDERFLEVFARALERGERLPVPGEENVLGPG